MDTVSHSLWLYLIFHRHKQTLPIIAGTITPDVSLFIAGLYLWLTGGKDPQSGWVESILSHPLWGPADQFSHSLLLWVPLLLIGLALSKSIIKFFAAGALLHVVIDIFTHKEFPLTYLFPLSSQQVSGLVDYRNPWFLAVNFTLLSVFIIYLYKKKNLV